MPEVNGIRAGKIAINVEKLLDLRFGSIKIETDIDNKKYIYSVQEYYMQEYYISKVITFKRMSMFSDITLVCQIADDFNNQLARYKKWME